MRIGDQLRIDTHLRVGFGASGVAADYPRDVTNEVTIEGRTLLIPSASHPGIVITSLGGAPGALGDEGPGDVFDPAPDAQAADGPHRLENDAQAAALARAVANARASGGPLDPGRTILNQIPPGFIRDRSMIGQIGQSYFRLPGNSAPPLSQIKVLTEQGDVTLLIDADTRISAPPDPVAGLETLTYDPPTRVAILTDRSPLAEDGTLSENQATARKIVVIPQVASRQHRRVVVAEETKGERIKFVDEAAGVADLAAKTVSKFEKGETVIILVQKGNSGVKRSRVKAVFKADVVAKRLERWADKETGRSGNAFRRGRIDALLEKHLDAQAKKLEKISAKAPKGMKGVVGQTVRRMVKDRNAAKTRLRIRGVGQANLECVRRLLGRVPATQKELTQDQQRRVDTECTVAKISAPPTVEITSPAKAETIFAGGNLSIGVEGTAGDSPLVSLEIIVNGVSQGVVNNPVGLVISEFQIPVDIDELNIEVTAMDSLGQTATDSFKMRVAQDPPPTVGGARLGNGWDLTGNGWNVASSDWNLTGNGWSLLEGEQYSISVQAEDNGKVESVDISIVGKSYPATLKDGKWVAEISIPAGPSDSGKIASNIIPHVFAGTAVIGGRPAPDGTVVTAWIPVAAGSSTSSIAITAVDNLSQIGSGTQEIKIRMQTVQVGRGVVNSGVYSLLIHQREGGSFAGRTVTFKLGELTAGQTGMWEAGAGHELNLHPSQDK